MRTIINLKNATVRIQMAKATYAKALAYFNCAKRGQLSLVSGEIYCQGNGWYLAILNEKFAPADAANRFITALTIALKHGDVITAAKAKLAQVTKSIHEFQAKVKLRVVKVDQVFHHGRLYSVARTHIASAFWNREHAIDGYIKTALAATLPVQPPSPSSLSNLMARFAH